MTIHINGNVRTILPDAPRIPGDFGQVRIMFSSTEVATFTPLPEWRLIGCSLNRSCDGSASLLDLVYVYQPAAVAP